MITESSSPAGSRPQHPDSSTFNEQTEISSSGRGGIRPVWAMLHYHYNRIKGLGDKYAAAMSSDLVGIEGGGDHGSTSGGYDQLGFGQLMYAE